MTYYHLYQYVEFYYCKLKLWLLSYKKNIDSNPVEIDYSVELHGWVVLCVDPIY